MSAVAMRGNVGDARSPRAVPPAATSAPKEQRIPGGLRYEEEHPREADLERRLLTLARRGLYGLAAALYPDQARRFREVLEGEDNRFFRLRHLVCLALMPCKETQAVVVAILAELAAAVGCRVVPLVRQPTDECAALREMVVVAAAFTAEAVDVLRDGLTPEEKQGLRAEHAALKACVAKWDGILYEAEEPAA